MDLVLPLPTRRSVAALVFSALFACAVLAPVPARADDGTVISLLKSMLELQTQVVRLLTSTTFFINPVLNRVGIGTKAPAAALDVHGEGASDTSVVIRYGGPIGHRAALILSNKAIGQAEGSAGIWTIAAGNAQTGTLGQRLGISGHSGSMDPNYKFMLDLSGNLELGSESMPSGITLYDTVTKKPYCVHMTNGVLTPTTGVCMAR